MAAALVWVGLAIGACLFAGLLFWLAARVVRVDSARLLGRSLAAAVFCGIVSGAVVAIVVLVTRRADGGMSFTAWWAALVLGMGVCVVILRGSLETSFGRALAVWCFAVGMAAATAVVALPVLPVVEGLLASWGVATRVAMGG